ncbi:hypothetical protein ACFO1B_38965 [Dactylosporangium siamense]|uniref:Uncharacterized protein n=1 Tax=Dactylosporangium siamense TaxID=685454 RepID=A0A919PUB4_9ACTN|nr:hypothetical protein [Dactylosporangium siamense]GIG50339.1 hypothetical protein Dsi01nite_083800 [Dactylosporangium siamense]
MGIGPVVAFCFGLLVFGVGCALAMNYRGFAVIYARRAERSARAVGVGRNRVPHPMDEHDRIVFFRTVGGFVALVGVVMMVVVVGGLLGFMDVTYGG